MPRLSILAVFILPTLLAVCCRPHPLPEVSPAQAGLTWQECTVPSLDWKQQEACFGHPRSVASDAERAHFGTRTDQGWRLTVGDGTYETSMHPIYVLPWEAYVLRKNGHTLRILLGRFSAYSPDVSLTSVGGKVAWEFSDGTTSTVVYDGKDVRSLYGVDAAYRPYDMAGKLIFVGKRLGRYFVVYDGRKIGPEFDHMIIAYCCETVLYSPRGEQGAYTFWGYRGGILYAVEVAPGRT